MPAYFKPVVIKNEGTLPAKVKLSLEAGDGCEAGEPILTEDNITIKQDPEKMQDCANRLAPVLKVFVYKLSLIHIGLLKCSMLSGIGISLIE